MWTRSRYWFLTILVAVLGGQRFLGAEDVAATGQAVPLVVLTNAKMHEAFVMSDDYWQDPPPVAAKAPPGELAEVKPAIAAELENRAVWIPGYWSFDPAEEGFVWTTGVWRFPPPGFRWEPGAWARTDNGFVRVKGKWVPQDLEKFVYVKAPPRYEGTLILPDALPGDRCWIPGAWVPEGDKFAWR
jgi:hypothetical protein